jgi:hypothetical protein
MENSWYKLWFMPLPISNAPVSCHFLKQPLHSICWVNVNLMRFSSYSIIPNKKHCISHGSQLTGHKDKHMTDKSELHTYYSGSITADSSLCHCMVNAKQVVLQIEC